MRGNIQENPRSLAALPSSAGGTEFVYGNMLELVAVPEPGTWFAAALALCAVGWSQRRRAQVICSQLSIIGKNKAFGKNS